MKTVYPPIHYVNSGCHPSVVENHLMAVVGELTGVPVHPSGIKPMHSLLYLRNCSSRKIMLTGKNLGYTVFTSRLFKETHIRLTQKNLGIGVTNFLITL